MKILFANARPPYPFIIGGDGVNIDTYFNFLAQKGHACMWLGMLAEEGEHKLRVATKRFVLLHKLGYHPVIIPGYSDGRVSLTVSYKKRYRCSATNIYNFLPELRKTINLERPDIILTQLEGSEVVVREARFAHIPSVVSLTDCEKSSLSRIAHFGADTPSGIICVSKYVYAQFKKIKEVPTKVFYPPICKSNYLVQKPMNGSYITCINPVYLKGGNILEKIIQQLPNEQFLIVKGWYDPVRDGLHFQNYGNVKMLEKQFDMKGIYEKTKILLVPSIWEEAIPRVIMEAGVNGIPSIASHRGGISEALGKGGILIDKPHNITSWVTAIHQLQTDTTRFQNASKAIKNMAKKFEIETIGPSFEHWLDDLIHTYEAVQH